MNALLPLRNTSWPEEASAEARQQRAEFKALYFDAPDDALDDASAQGYASQPSRYLADLPVLFHDQAFLGRFLRIFETLWEPLEGRQDHIAFYLDPRTCPVAWLPWLARWCSLPVSEHWPEARLRAVLTVGPALQRCRGTHFSLEQMLAAFTGQTPLIFLSESQPFICHVRLAQPLPDGINRAALERFIQTHKPAHLGYVLEIGS